MKLYKISNSPAIYKSFLNHMAELLHLMQINGFLDWDSRTYMPEDAIDQKTEEMILLNSIFHNTIISSRAKELYKQLLQETALSSIPKRNLILWKRSFDQESKLPIDFIRTFTKQAKYTKDHWLKAKQKADFSLISEDLEKLVELIKKKAEYLDSSKTPYNVLLNYYEYNLNIDQINNYFDPLKTFIKPLFNRIVSSPLHESHSREQLFYSATSDQQFQIAQLATDFLELDKKKTRLDLTEHPFCTGIGNDVRITTHFHSDNPMDSFFTLLHEGGHALYNLELPKEFRWQFVGQDISMGIHESQSRFCENIIGLNPSFLTYIFPKIQKIIPVYRKLSLEDFILANNYINPSKIRIESDEISYNFHIILRYELERELFLDKISVRELPELWNAKMQEYLDQSINNDAEGILQDIHWFNGDFGYFPTYVLGNIYASQFWHAITKAIPDWNSDLLDGNFHPIHDWLRVNVHEKGSLFDPLDLIRHSTHEPLTPQYFNDYLQAKYSWLYNL